MGFESLPSINVAQTMAVTFDSVGGKGADGWIEGPILRLPASVARTPPLRSGLCRCLGSHLCNSGHFVFALAVGALEK